MPVALAPLIWWVVLYYFLLYFNIVELNVTQDVYITISYEWLKDWNNWWIVYTILQLLWAGRLSDQDFKVFFTGLFSISGIITFAAIISCTAVF